MYSARSETHFLAAPASFALHALLIALAVRATTVHPTVTAHDPAHVAWPVFTLPAPTHPLTGTSESGPGSGGVLAAPLIDPIDATSTQSSLPSIKLPGAGSPVAPGSVVTQGGGSELGALISSIDQADAPVVVTMEKPSYPSDAPARAAGISDSVVVEYRVSEAGTVPASGVTIVTATDPRFTRAVLLSLERARFRPARQQGVAVPSLVRQQFRFVR